MEWVFDTAHSNADFSVRHMMISTVRGGFKDVSGKLNFDPQNLAASSVEAVIKTGTIWTGINDRDNHLRSADFFDSANFPDITFKSTKVEVVNPTHAKVTGDLTIRDTTKSVVLDVEFIGEQKNPFTGKSSAGFSATTTINREDFGLTWNVALEAGGWLVGKEIKVSLDVEAVAVEETATA
ncbi:MAG TPA: YceI family protein [Aggregatilineales bacterium]|nr:YceI family protein [Aggregatilineales bacterium]